MGVFNKVRHYKKENAINILITGATGFVGSHLATYILKNIKRNVTIFGTAFPLKETVKGINLLTGDLQDRQFVAKVINRSNPDLIFHLAAIAFVGTSLTEPDKVILNNITAQLNLLEEIRQQKRNPKILIVSSAECYGAVSKSDNPISETQGLAPVSSQGLSKVAQDLMGYVYYKSYGLQIIRVRPFNHIGPRQSPDFVVSSFAKQIAEIEKDVEKKVRSKKRGVIRVGNLSARRDFTDVSDIVRAYWLALEKGKIGEVYNLGSGKDYAISWILDTLLSLSNVKIVVETDPSRLRPSEIPVTICNYQKFRNQTGWEPKIPIEQTLKDVLDYWRKEV
jgi:GDP-4-dehydro-6-deoxy-D-mannose reductase